MKLQVKEVTSVEEKSSQEVEANLLKKHEVESEEKVESSVDETPVEQTSVDETPVEQTSVEEVKSNELRDEDVLSYINKRYNKEIGSVDDLFAQKKQ